MEESKLTGESQFATIEAEGEGESELVKIDTTDSKLKLRKNFAPTSTIGRIVETEQKDWTRETVMSLRRTSAADYRPTFTTLDMPKSTTNTSFSKALYPIDSRIRVLLVSLGMG